MRAAAISWVVSVSGEGEASASVLHKLQLVSGRGLGEARTAPAASPVRFVDVTVTPDGTVYALDAADSRIFRLRPGGRALESVMRLDARRPTAFTAADDRIALRRGGEGSRARGRRRPFRGAGAIGRGADVRSNRWRGAPGRSSASSASPPASLIVRIPLDASGVRAQPRHVLAASTDATVGTLAGDAYYYVAAPGVIRRLSLK